MTLFSTEAFRHRAAQLGVTAADGTDNALAALFAEVLRLAQDKEFRERFFKVPFPPLEGTGIGYASDYPDINYTVGSGRVNINTINKLWMKFRDPKPIHRVLDFGSGSGRLLRFPLEFGENIELHGCDVNPKAVRWLQDNFGCPMHLVEKPHDLSFIDGPLDLIYCWSIFTHFSEAEHRRWLDTMMDKLTPGGILVATFKTPAMLERVRKDEAYRIKSRAQNIDLVALEAKAESGFAYFECYDPEKSDDHGIDAATFGQAYISHKYIRDNWSEKGEVVHIGMAVPEWQDIAVVKKL